MGQPVYWKPYIEPSLLWDRQDGSNAGFQLVGGISYDWLGKAIGAFSVSAEGYYRYVDSTSDGGGRLIGWIPFLDDEAGKDEEHMNAFVEKINDAKTFIHSKDEQFPDGHTFEAVIDVYHSSLGYRPPAPEAVPEPLIAIAS
jgi:hypothetical protein